MIGVDLLEMTPLPGVRFLRGDFGDDAVLARLVELLGGRAVDLVLSDMAPNISGVASVDQARSIALAELALDFAVKHLKPQGNFLVKVFQGAGLPEYRKALQQAFATLVTRKPEASRARSKEIYLLAKGFLGV